MTATPGPDPHFPLDIDRYATEVCRIVDILGLDADHAVGAVVHLASGHDMLMGIDISWRRLGAAVIVELADGRRCFIHGDLAKLAAATLDTVRPTMPFELGDSTASDGVHGAGSVAVGQLVTMRRSGAYEVAFGSNELIGKVALGDDAAAVRSYLDEHGLTIAHGGEMPVGAHRVDDTTVLVDGDDRTVRIWRHAGAGGPAAAARLPDFDDYVSLGHEIGVSLGLRLEDTVLIGSRVAGVVDVEYLYIDETASIVVPATVANDLSYSVGRPTGGSVILPTLRIGGQFVHEPVDLPSGWTFVEQASDEPGVVALHDNSGIRALVRNMANT